MVLAAVGVVLVGTEIFVVPGMIWPGLVGATCLVVGLLMSQVGPDLSMGDAWDRQLLFDATYQLVATAAAGVFAIWTLSRFLPQTPVLGRMVLAGAGGAADAMPEARDESRLQRARPGARWARPPPISARWARWPSTATRRAPTTRRASRAAPSRGGRVKVIEVNAGRLVVESVELVGVRWRS